MTDIEVVNIVGSADLQREVDIKTLAEDASLPVSNYDPKSNASFFRFEEDEELVIMYTSGKYILRGGDEFKKTYEVNNQLLDFLKRMGLEIEPTELDINNVVAVGNIDQEINLNTLMIELGMEKVEYEPEQFPGLVYRPDQTNCVLIVFGTGKIVITGGRTEEEDQKAFEAIKKQIEQSVIG
jgi:transcription initiation factor TFIID TATA-box-binding protein